MEKLDIGGSIPPGLVEICKGYQDDFMQEIRGLLDEIDLSLVNLAADPSDKDLLVQAYARFHTIAGLSGLLQEQTGLRLAQASEDLIEVVRKYRPGMESSSLNHLVQSSKFLRRLASDPAIHGDSRFLGEVGQHLSGLRQSRNDLFMEVRQPLEHETRIGEILIHEGTMEKSEVEDVLSHQRSQSGRMKFGEILLKEKRVDASDVIRAIRMQKIRSALPAGQSVRIPLERMEQLAQLMEELQGRCSGIHAESLLRFGNKDRFSTETSGIANQLGDLRRILGELRVVSFQQTFARVTQSVGSLMEERRRSIRIVTMGEGTEVDMSLADQLVQPMADLVMAMAEASATAEEEKRLGLMEMVAFQEAGAVHIDLTGDGSADVGEVFRNPAYDRAARRISTLGGRLQIDDLEGAGMRSRLLFPVQEGHA